MPGVLAAGLSSIEGMKVDVDGVETNIVMFEPPSAFTAPHFIELMAASGVRFTHPGGHRVRAVTHRMVSRDDIDEALRRIKEKVV